MKPLLLCLLPALLHTAEPRLLMLGDSITYDGRWTTGVEWALRGTPAFAEAEIVNAGLPSETATTDGVGGAHSGRMMAR